MKSLLFALLLLVGFGAQAAALPCAQGEIGAHHIRAAVHADGAQTAVELDRVVHEQHCDCSPLAAVARASLTGPGKFAQISSVNVAAVSQAASFAEMRSAHAAHGRSVSGASPASVLPLYLLTARLRR